MDYFKQWLSANQGEIIETVNGESLEVGNCFNDLEPTIRDINLLNNLVCLHQKDIQNNVYVDIFNVEGETLDIRCFKNGKSIDYESGWDFLEEECYYFYLEDIENHLGIIEEYHKDMDISELIEEIYPNLCK